MVVFDKTESLVMMPLRSAFTAADKTNVLAAGSIAEMILQRVKTNVVLCCCHMNMPSARRAKFADSTSTKTRRSSANNCRSCVCQSYVELPKEKETAHA